MSIRGQRTAVVVGVVGVLMTSGCGASRHTVVRPTAAGMEASGTAAATPTPGVPSASGPNPSEMVQPAVALTSEQEAVLAAYRAWWQKCVPAADKNPERAVDILRECGTQDAAERRGGAIQRMQANGSIRFGRPVLKPRPPIVNGDYAVVRDCQDTRGYGQRRKADGALEAQGIEKYSYESGLIKQNGVWKIDAGNEPRSGNLEEYCS